MRVLTNLSLAPAGDRDEVPVSDLLADGRPTGVRLNGAVLEAAVECNDHFLVFLTDDVPFEEVLQVVLLNRAFQEVESLCIGSAYSTGSFSDLALEPPDTVRFRFIGGTTWRITVMKEQHLRIPIFSDPTGVHRGFRVKSRLAVRGNPVPEGVPDSD